MRSLLGFVLGAISFGAGGWMRWCPSPTLNEMFPDGGGEKMFAELGICLLALGTFLIGTVLHRWIAPREW